MTTLTIEDSGSTIVDDRPRARRSNLNRFTEVQTGYDSPCLIWSGPAFKNGYGMLRHPITGKTATVHKTVYELHRGPVPAGLELDHLCAQKRCCRISHLEPVTRTENVRRSRVCKLTQFDVDAIRASSSQVELLAVRYQVSAKHIGRIRRFEQWKPMTPDSANWSIRETETAELFDFGEAA